jgi:predicted  nucleic acid-binding Zn-ribbon protein
MSRSAPLYLLQQIDSEILSCRQRLAAIDGQLGETDELAAARNRLNEIRDSMRTSRVRQRDEELQLQSLQQKKRASEQRLYGGKVRNPKELSDLQAEIKSLTRRQEVIEEAVFEVMVTIEELETAENQSARDLQRIERKWEQESTTKRLTELLTDRRTRADTIPPSDLDIYEHLRDRKGGLAVAQLTGAECQGCMTTVSASRVKEARGSTLAFCGTCGRILYPMS